MMQWHDKKKFKVCLVLLIDSSIFVFALCLAYLLRFDFELHARHVSQIKLLLPYFIIVKLAAFYAFGLYRDMWRYTSIEDLRRLIQVSFILIFCSLMALVYLNHDGNFSRAVFCLDGLLTLVMTSGIRVAIRYYFRSVTKGLGTAKLPIKDKAKILIMGAGSAGEQILREILTNPRLCYEVVGFLDDNPGKQGRSIHGIPVLGALKKLPSVLQEHGDIKEVFTAIRSANGETMRRIVDACESLGVSHKTLPGLGEVINGKVSVNSLRQVNYQDLLRRAPVQLETSGIRDSLFNRTILVTGCGGSIGSELCRQIIRFQPRELILFDAHETNLFNIEMELSHERNFYTYHAILGRVQNQQLMDSVFETHKPDIVFHAAANKHVPMMEVNSWEAVFNNIVASRVVMQKSLEHAVKRFVLVSTDKAVRPTNVMGASKRVAELLMQSFQGKGTYTRFMAVRFGNVVDSSGSVLPLFRRQVAYGGPVTLTHTEASRYFMTIPEAAQLILQAGAMGTGGEIFILKMGMPVKIADLAEDIIRLAGKEPGRDIEIVVTGLREGEKLTEELISEGEDVITTAYEDILVLRSNGYFYSATDPIERVEWLNKKLDELLNAALEMDEQAIKLKLHEIVPEYTPYIRDIDSICLKMPQSYY